MDSRSSSPETPEASDVSNNVAIHGDLPSWYRTSHVANNIPSIELWEELFQKPDDVRMLQLDDIIQEHAYDDSGLEIPPLNTRPAPAATDPERATADPLRTSVRRSFQGSGLSIPLSQMHSTPIIPPPAMRTSKRDPASVPRRIVYPSRESCFNLTILTPNIPESGTKSRVETQVRVAVDLAYASTSAGDQDQYDRVGSWKWLKLPPGTSTKKRTRREGKIDPAPQDILHLAATVTCASAPHSRVVSCGSCRNREAKRVARKLAARVRPAHSDSDTPEDGCERSRGVKEDTTSIIQFNCSDVLDFSAGSTVLPVRITCYCRHHREKVGFNIHFTMMDHNGRLVGTGMTPPIMITDDHKSTMKSGAVQSTPTMETQVDWSGLIPPSESTTHLKHSTRNGKGHPKTRAKPYDVVGRNNQSKFSREASVTSLTSPINSPPVHPATGPNTRSPTPTQLAQSSSPPPAQPPLTLITGAEPSPSFNASELVSPSLNNNLGTDMFSSPNGISTIATPQFPSPFPSNTMPVTQPSQLLPGLVSSQSMPFFFFSPDSPPPATSLPLPKIHRLIPSCGPIRGGIEVTVLGENFHPAIQLNCVFGDVVASSTQRWSDNTLLCVLPPRSTPGVVAVWFEGLDETKNSTLPSLFTYTDETDRTLMELALQVVGLKMTGKIEDAKNIALRIVGSIGTEEQPSGSDSPTANDIMQVASSSFHDIRSLFLRPGGRHNHEAAIINLLSLIDIPVENHSGISSAVAMSHVTSSGQTLLHLAVFLKFASLTKFLLAHGIDPDARDRNGYTALHFATLGRSRECARLLVLAGADPEVVDALGKTAEDIAPPDFFERVFNQTSEPSWSELEDELHSEEVQSDTDTPAAVIEQSHISRVARRHPYQPHDCHEHPETASSQVSQSPWVSEDVTAHKLDDASKEKQAASFVAMIQRTLAQIPAPQGIIPTMPQLPLPHLPEMPTVPWNALPQIPMVFPVFVPMPGWPSFLSDKRDGSRGDGDSRPAVYSTAQELRATWEKWLAVAMASASLRSPIPDEAPPMYTPREIEETVSQEPSKDAAEVQEPGCTSVTLPPSSAPDRTTSRVDHDVTQMVAPDADVYEATPTRAHVRAARNYDRMLMLFWLPILLLSLLWAFHNCIRFALQVLKSNVPIRTGGRT